MADTKAYRVVKAERVADPDQGFDWLYIYLTFDDATKGIMTVDMTTTTDDWTDPTVISSILTTAHTGGSDDSLPATF